MKQSTKDLIIDLLELLDSNDVKEWDYSLEEALEIVIDNLK